MYALQVGAPLRWITHVCIMLITIEFILKKGATILELKLTNSQTPTFIQMADKLSSPY